MSSWKDNLRTIDPYVPGEQPQLSDMIKLNTNENPYPPSPKARDVLTNFALDTLRLYPDPDSSLLVNAIAKRYEVGADQVFVGVLTVKFRFALLRFLLHFAKIVSS